MGKFQRAVGLAIFGTAMLGALLLWASIAAGDPESGNRPAEGAILGVWRVFYDTDAPSIRVLLADVPPRRWRRPGSGSPGSPSSRISPSSGG